MSAFNTGLSGLRANSEAVETVGNNLANLNTPGFKASSVVFRDLLSLSGEAGLGTASPILEREFTQGTVQSSSGALDSAISGDGFFVFRSSDNQQLYSRAGNLQIDSQGRVVAPGGELLQGWSGSLAGVDTNGPVGDIVVPVGALRPAQATASMGLDLNLDAAGQVGNTSGSFTTGVQVFDSLGKAHTASLTFKKTGPNDWSYTVTMPGEDFTGGTAGTPKQLATGTLSFDSSGQLTSPAAPTSGSPGGVEIDATGLASGAADLKINWALYGSDLNPKVTQFALPSATSSTDQDGYAAAQVMSIGMADGGRVQARLSTGEEITVAQVALANFRNPSSLDSVGYNFFSVGPSTSAPVIGIPETGGRGKVVARALEASTVDVAQEFTNLIVYQRSYQANSRVITTADEMTQETLNIKR